MVYRADKPSNPSPIQFTWTNNSNSETVEFVFAGKKTKLGASNTADGLPNCLGRERRGQPDRWWNELSSSNQEGL